MGGAETEQVMVERHVAEGLVRLARQRALIARLGPDNALTAFATVLLATMEGTQRLHERHRASLRYVRVGFKTGT